MKDTFAPVRALAAGLLAQSPTNFPSGPDGLEQLLGAFYLLWGGGFMIAVLGHLFKARTLVIAGIVLVSVGTALFFVAVAVYD